VTLSQTAAKKKWTADPLGEGVFDLQAPIDVVAKALAKLFKPDRHQLAAVRYVDGCLEEIQESSYRVNARPTQPAVAAVSVAVPVRGCPAPDFASAEIKARRVLDVFLNDDQRADFRQHNRFVTIGAVSGHRYMVTSRHARSSLHAHSRSLYDLDAQMPICTHDWSVPAAEEMLALHLCVSLPSYEQYITGLVDD